MTIEQHTSPQSNNRVSQRFIAAQTAMQAAANRNRSGRGPEWPRMTEREIHDLIRDTLG